MASKEITRRKRRKKDLQRKYNEGPNIKDFDTLLKQERIIRGYTAYPIATVMNWPLRHIVQGFENNWFFECTPKEQPKKKKTTEETQDTESKETEGNEDG